MGWYGSWCKRSWEEEEDCNKKKCFHVLHAFKVSSPEIVGSDTYRDGGAGWIGAITR